MKIYLLQISPYPLQLIQLACDTCYSENLNKQEEIFNNAINDFELIKEWKTDPENWFKNLKKAE